MIFERYFYKPWPIMGTELVPNITTHLSYIKKKEKRGVTCFSMKITIEVPNNTKVES
jgi:hypothetical protein